MDYDIVIIGSGCAGMGAAIYAAEDYAKFNVKVTGTNFTENEATGAGAVAGVFVASKMVTPPGAAEFAKATQTISKLDIQPEQ